MRRIAKSEWIHGGFWLVLAAVAYVTAGPYTLSSCWILIPLLLLSSTLAQVMLVAFALFMIFLAVIGPSRILTPDVNIAAHIVVFAAGLAGCYWAAYLSAGQVSCL